MSLTNRLRQESRDAHRRLEEEVGIVDRIRDVAAYRHLLEHFLGFYAPLETRIERLAGWHAWGYDPVARRKSAWLSHDLGALGRESAEIVSLPLCAWAPTPENLAEGFGCAYVLEGATLGGRQISSWLDGSAIPAGARRFFQSYGEQVGRQWKEFCAALDQFGRTENTHEAVIHATAETFDALRRWLNRPEVPA